MALDGPVALALASLLSIASSISCCLEAAIRAAVMAGLDINSSLFPDLGVPERAAKERLFHLSIESPGQVWRDQMAARPTWRGVIKLALVSIPVEIYPATKSGKSIAFHQVHEPSGKRVRYEKVVPGIGPVDRDEILKGFEVSKGNYVLLDPEEIEKVKLESRKTLDLTQFVDLTDIDPIYFDKPYYVVPADDLAEEAFVVVREALKRTRKVGIGQLA